MALRPDLIKGAYISRMKANTTITAELTNGGANEIREAQWQGRDFSYPCVRVRILSVDPMQPDCNRYEITVAIAVFSEEGSSYQADRISGIISNELHGSSFSQTVQSQAVRLSCWTNEIIPAVRISERTWRSEILQRATASG